MKDCRNMMQFLTRRCTEHLQVAIVHDISGSRIGFRDVLDDALNGEAMKEGIRGHTFAEVPQLIVTK
jgi:hypothetical protein